MTPPKFLIGTLPNGEQRWAAIDPSAPFLEGRVAERRFPAYCSPFRSEVEAQAALIAAVCQPDSIAAEKRKRGRHGAR